MGLKNKKPGMLIGCTYKAMNKTVHNGIGYLYNTNTPGPEREGVWMVGVSCENGGVRNIALDALVEYEEVVINLKR